VEVNRILKPKLAIMDAIVGIEGRGPTYGNPRRLDLVMASRDLVALDASAMRLVCLDPVKARHVKLAYQQGLGEWREDHIALDGEFDRHRTAFVPARYDIVLRGMDFLSPQKWFTYGILLNPRLFASLRTVSRALRRANVVR
jgi:hypothetical protein